MAKCKGSQKLSIKKLMFKHLLAVALASRQGYKNVVHNELSFIHGFVDVNKYLGFCKFMLFLLLHSFDFPKLYCKFWSNLRSGLCFPSLGLNTG